MITLQELCHYLKDLLERPGITDYCPNGLQIEGKSKINKIATAVSASLATIEEAVKQDVDVLIVHHGLLWKRDALEIVGIKKEKIGALIDKKMSLIAYHLPLDIHEEVGNNWKAAKDLGWTDLQPFGLLDGLIVGVKGRFAPISRDKFQKQIEEYYEHTAICALGGSEKVSTAGLISGGGYRAIPEAASAGLDCFISGNFDEPAWSMAYENTVNFYALGHTATERVGPKALAENLSRKFQQKIPFIDTPNPF